MAKEISPIALEAVKRFDAIFRSEREINSLTAEARHDVRQQLVRPMVQNLHDWLRADRAQMSKHNPVAKAINYMFDEDGRWEAFTRFLDDGQKRTRCVRLILIYELCHTTDEKISYGCTSVLKSYGLVLKSGSLSVLGEQVFRLFQSFCCHHRGCRECGRKRRTLSGLLFERDGNWGQDIKDRLVAHFGFSALGDCIPERRPKSGDLRGPKFNAAFERLARTQKTRGSKRPHGRGRSPGHCGTGSPQQLCNAPFGSLGGKRLGGCGKGFAHRDPKIAVADFTIQFDQVVPLIRKKLLPRLKKMDELFSRNSRKRHSFTPPRA